MKKFGKKVYIFFNGIGDRVMALLEGGGYSG
jgi:hypothetical protein